MRETSSGPENQPSEVHSHLLDLHATQRLIKAEYANPKSLQDTLRPLSQFARFLPHKLAKGEGPCVCSAAGLGPESPALDLKAVSPAGLQV